MKKPSRSKAKPLAPAPPEAPVLPPQKPSNLWGETLTTILLFVCAFLIVIGAKAYIVQPYVVDGQSMETTLQNSDRLLVDKLPSTIAHITHHTYVPKRGDIIIFNQDNLPGFVGTKQLIKRVIGLPGDRVVVQNGSITVYNSAHPKGFNPDSSGRYHALSPTLEGRYNEVTLGAGQLFVCGDNRPNSEDSRAFGPINASQIVGKLSFRIFPFSKLHHY